MSLYLDDGDVRLYHGDVEAVLAQLPERSVQTCVTSPPYWGLRDYGTGEWTGGDADCDHQALAQGNPERERAITGKGVLALPQGIAYRDVCGRCGARRVDAQIGLEATPDLYVERLVAVFREVRRVLRDDGTLWLNLGDSYNANTGRGFDTNQDGDKNGKKSGAALAARMPWGKPKDLVGIPWRVAFALQADGWYLRSDIIWAKPNPMPESVTDRPTKAHEYVFLLTKQPRYYYDADAIREASEERVLSSWAERREHEPMRRGDPGESGHVTRTATLASASGRNSRSVWEIATQPFPEAHFATFPEELARRCILAGTSEAGECSTCGAPWQRQTEYEYTPKNNGSTARNIAANTAKGITSGQSATRPVSGSVGQATPKHALGWAASCACGAPTRPQQVLDPFAGSGTTCLVARKHGRRSVGIDLSSEYLEIAARRLSQLSLLSEEAHHA